MQVSTTLVDSDVKQTAKGLMFKFKEASGQWLATNEQALAERAKSLLNTPLVLEISEQISNNVNPRTGQPYVNRYLNQIVSAGVQQQTALPAPPMTFTTPGTTGAIGATITAPGVEIQITARDRSIWAQSASKVAAHLLTFFPEGERTLHTFDTLVQREIDKYQAHHTGNPHPTPSQVAATFAAGGMVPTSVTDTAPPHGDEDIPF